MNDVEKENETVGFITDIITVLHKYNDMDKELLAISYQYAMFLGFLKPIQEKKYTLSQAIESMKHSVDLAAEALKLSYKLDEGKNE